MTVNPGFSLNIILLSILAVRVPQKQIPEQPIEVSGLEVISTYTLGFVNLNLTVGLMRTVNRFYVISIALCIICYWGVPGVISIKLAPPPTTSV